MAIKQYYIVSVFMIFVLCNLAIISMGSGEGTNTVDSSQREGFEPKISELELTDKVFTFHSAHTSENWDLYLVQEYIYWIYLEIVTPGECNVKITVKDTENEVFRLLEEDIYFLPEYGRYVEVPFGSTDSGQHNFKVDVVTADPINIYVRIEQGPKCLEDKMSNGEINGMVSREAIRFYDGMSIDHDINLKEDFSYKIYIGRVTGISEELSNKVTMDFYIEDPDGLDFPIFVDDTMAGPDQVNWSYFGTSQEGIYEINIVVHCDQPYVNIAFALIDNSQISEKQDVNDTKAPDKEDEAESIFEGLVDGEGSLPPEFLAGTIIVAALGVGGAVLAFTLHKKNPSRRLDLNK